MTQQNQQLFDRIIEAILQNEDSIKETLSDVIDVFEDFDWLCVEGSSHLYHPIFREVVEKVHPSLYEISEEEEDE